MRVPSVPCFLGAIAVVVPAVAFAHVDDPKEAATQAPYDGAGWRESQGGVAGLDFPKDGITLRSWVTAAELGHAFGNDCWGYTSASGREYALMGLSEGMAVVEVTDPGNPVVIDQIPGPSSTWRDVKVYQNYCYIVTEASGPGIQVVDLTFVDSGVVNQLADVTTGGSTPTHNVAINEDSGYLYRCGGGSNGLRIYDLSNPASPVWVADWTDRYVHDAQIVSYTSGPYAGKEIAFCCGGLNGGFQDTGLDVVDVTDKQNIVVLSHTGYPNPSYSHQAWLSDDKQYLYLNDEINEQDFALNSTTHIIDVSNLSAPFQVTAYTNTSTASTHNLYVKDSMLYASNYRSGLRVYDLAVPTAPVEVAYFDTYPSDDVADYNGLWSNYPFFESGTIIGSDREKGFFVWSMGGTIVEFAYPNGRPDFIDPAGDTVRVQTSTTSGGVESTGGLLHYDNGSGEQTTPLVLAEGGGDQFDAVFPELVCPSTVSWYVTVVADDGSTWRDPFNGAYSATVAVNTAYNFDDDFESDTGWSVANDPALTDGAWERGTPVGGGDRGDPAVDADGSGQCYLTDNADGNSDVDGGTTTLTSPIMDATGTGDAYLAYDRWYSNNFGGSPNEDSMPIEISNDGGANWLLLENVTENAGAWVPKLWRIDDVITPTSTMQVRFIAGDLINGSVVEAAVDGVQIIFFDCDAIEPPCVGDANGDGVTDVNDLNAVILDWGTDGSANGGDLTGATPGSPADGLVDVNDLNAVIVNWGACP